MRGGLSPSQVASGVAGAGVAIWLGDYLFPDAGSDTAGHALFGAGEALVGLCLGLIAHELALSFRSWLP